jgi:hypothetical protein
MALPKDKRIRIYDAVDLAIHLSMTPNDLVNGKYSHFNNTVAIERHYVRRVAYVPTNDNVQWIWRAVDQQLHYNVSSSYLKRLA